MVVSGQLGIIDAKLVHFLQSCKEKTNQLFIHVSDSIYKSIIPKSHIDEFLGELSVVDGIVHDKTSLDQILQYSNITQKTFPGKELPAATDGHYITPAHKDGTHLNDPDLSAEFR